MILQIIISNGILDLVTGILAKISLGTGILAKFRLGTGIWYPPSRPSNMASLDSKGEIVPMELSNPEETQLQKGENEPIRSR